MALKLAQIMADMFKCHTCAKIYDKMGKCCGKALEGICRMCGFGKEL